MARLCQLTPVPIALDEELLAKYPAENKKKLLEIIRPQFIVIKPGLLGGFRSSEEWISLANDTGIEWWVTSALESNIGLNAIAQWAYSLDVTMPQGLGTGMIYSNNIISPLAVVNGSLRYFPRKKWDLKLFS
jgi:O-succinylbenzoate synthase